MNKDINISAETLYNYQAKIVELFQFGADNSIPDAVQWGLLNHAYIFAVSRGVPNDN